MGLYVAKLHILNKNLFLIALSGFVAVITILILSVVIGVSVYTYMNKAYEVSRPPLNSIEIRIACYNLSNQYLCLASNPLEYRVSVKLYLYNESGKNVYSKLLDLEPSSTKPLFCDAYRVCSLASARIVGGEALLGDGEGRRLRVVVVYR
jgi:hypothetical protein